MQIVYYTKFHFDGSDQGVLACLTHSCPPLSGFSPGFARRICQVCAGDNEPAQTRGGAQKGRRRPVQPWLFAFFLVGVIVAPGWMPRVVPGMERNWREGGSGIKQAR
jgi:hypothetical protein